MLKFSDNPPLLAPGADAVAQVAGTWWIAHTKARCEKALAWDLLKQRVAYFLPMVERVKFSGGRKRRMLMPLFPSYLFFAGSPQVRADAFRTDRVANVIPVTDQARLVTELSGVELALAANAELDLYPFAAVGRRCRVIAGPFMGIEGIVVERKERARLVLQVSMLGQGAALEIDLDLLEPVEDAGLDQRVSAGSRAAAAAGGARE